jgi:hypothetical protein
MKSRTLCGFSPSPAQPDPLAVVFFVLILEHGIKKLVVLILDWSNEVSSGDRRRGRDRQRGFDNCAFAVRLDFQNVALALHTDLVARQTIEAVALS